jgi:DNA-binding NtrC family response regulator/tetratricopeptide (TPR) repeat protein
MAREGVLPAAHPTDGIVGHCPAIQALRAQIRHLAAFDAVGNPYVPTLLLQGETGTGKGLVARAIHDSGPRAQGPFIEVNCGAIPEALLEAELFGFEAGAFTDAKRPKPGLFEAADGGTLFLDEIDTLPLSLQSKLLNAIEAKRIRRLGAVSERPVDVKLITATHADLGQEIAAGHFRADLYHRLAVVLLELPPLRARGDDILALALHFLRRYADAHGVPSKRLSSAAEAWLLRYDWPGNVRELSHLMERLTLLSAEAILAPETMERLCLPRSALSPQPESAPAGGVLEPLDEPARIRQALIQAEGNVLRAARLLGLSRSALRHRMRRYGIARPGREELAQPPGTPAERETSLPTALPFRPAGSAKPPAQDWGDAEDRPVDRAKPLPEAGWAQKPVAVLAINVTFPETGELEPPRYEPWTVAARWEQRIVENVVGFGGLLLQRSPPLVLVAFGIPQTLEQLPQRAVHAALAMRQLVVEAAGSAERAACPEVRLAVHGGTIFVDTQARDPAARVLPVGDTLTLPVRLLGFTAPGEILLSSQVGRAVEGWYEIQTRELLTGDSAECIAASTLVGFRPQRSSLARMGKRTLSRFVGREWELAALREALSQAEGGRGQVVGIVGEPGVGKSRLLYEFRQHMTAERVLSLEGDCTSYGAAVLYLPLLDLLKTYFQLDDRDEAPRIRDKVAGRLLMLDEGLSPTLPALLTLLDVPVEDPQWQVLDPPQRRQRIMEALKRLLVCESQVQPVVMIVENLHWVDTETQTFLDSLVESLPAVRMLLLVTYRPEYRHGWGHKTFYTQLRLDPLPRQGAQALLQALLGNDASLRALTQQLIERTEGNPFFLEETIQTLVETQLLAGQRGAYRLAKALPRLQVPATVQAVLGARIDRLPSEERSLLQSAAVIGRDVPLPLLRAIAEQPEAALHRGLTHLQAAEFLYETRLFPDREYTFKHALTHEVAYGSLLQERRRALHAHVVGALETLAGDRVAEHVERLAYHAVQGEVWDKALAYCRQAGARAAARSAYQQAVGCIEQALAALALLPEHRDTLEQAIDLRCDLRNALWLLGEFGQVFDYLCQAETLAMALGDQARLGRVSTYMSAYLWAMGDPDRSLESGRRALTIAEALGDGALQVEANYRLGQAYLALGDYRRAMGFLGQNVSSLTGHLMHQRFGLPGIASVVSRSYLAWCLAELGEFVEGIARGEEAVRIAEAADHPFSLSNALFGVGYLYLRKGDFRNAVPALEQCLALCRLWNIALWSPRITSALGSAYALSWRVAEALPLLEQAIAQAASENRLGEQALRVAALGEAFLLADRMDEAFQTAQRALALSRAHKERGHEAWALRLRGEIAAQRDPPDRDTAEACYRQALALAGERRMRPLMAHCHLGLGTLYTRVGQREQAGAELSMAVALYRALDMTFWLSRAEAALARML